ncbi:MAG: gliding motility-associated C-terminal domain-containing protein [Fluviicola sp.]|jgi:gliding motility-associated-like protein
MMKKALFAFVFFATNNLYSQFPGCPNVDAGPDQNLTCVQSCATLTATPFHAGATSTYIVGSIPHTPPIAYNAPGGTAVSAGTDDVWSPQIALPFTFCYYGQSYTTCKVGSNGSIKFGTYAPTSQPWSFTASCPSTALTGAGDVFGVYHDIDPSLGGNISWYLIGSAPCRIFVVSFNNIPHFSCTSINSTHMIVLYETTNVIDVYVQEKQTCTSWNGGNAIIGIQNPSGTSGIAAPNRNTAPDWTVTSPEAWRFTPDGAPIYTTEWFDGATSLGTNPVVSVCPTITTTYTAQTTYTACDGNVIIESDNVTVTPNTGSPSISQTGGTPSSCVLNNGTIDVSGTGGAGGYQYSIDNGVTFQSGTTFTNLGPGSYPILVQDLNGCSGTVNATVSSPAPVVLTLASSSNPACNGSSDGQIDLSATGTSPFFYSLNSGTPQSSPNFSGLASGVYSMSVVDGNGCTDNLSVTLTDPTVVNLSIVSTNPELCSAANGSTEVSASGGSGSYTYVLLPNPTGQATGLFSNLSSGTYTIEVSDAQGCINSQTVTVGNDSPLIISVDEVVDASCFGLSDGEMTVSGLGTAGPFVYSINGTPQATPIFTDLSEGLYELIITDPNGCSDTITEFILEPTPVVVNGNNPSAICTGTNSVVSATASGGTGVINFTWSNSLPNGPSNSVSPTSTTTYIVSGTDVNGCVGTDNITVTVNPLPVINAGSDVTICLGQSVTLSGSGGVAYSWSGGVLNSSPFSPATGINNFTVTGTDANGCIGTDNVTVTVLPNPVASLGSLTSNIIDPNQSVTFSNTSILSTNFTFDFGNSQTLSTSSSTDTPTITYTTPGTYLVILEAENGFCSDFDSLIVTVNPFLPVSFIAPNIITPNNDGKNDAFDMSIVNAVSADIIIVNRWGNKIAEISGVNPTWIAGEEKEGVYFFKYFIVGLDGKEYNGHGNFELLR